MNGILSGGWNFVVGAYALSAVVLGTYGMHIVRTFFKARGSADAERSLP